MDASAGTVLPIRKLKDKGINIIREAEGQQATISYKELADLIDLMIYTKVIEIKVIKNDLKYWAFRQQKNFIRSVIT